MQPIQPGTVTVDTKRMLELALVYQLDWLAFAAVSFAGLYGVHRWIARQNPGHRLARWAWPALAVLVLLGGGFAYLAGESERSQMRSMLEGIAPTYAAEMERLGHASLTLQSPADDPAYLIAIEAEKRWLSVNPNVVDIYTFRKNAKGEIALLVDSETDYDRNGKIEGDREQRTQIGEVYEPTEGNLDEIERAFTGVKTFEGVPMSDRWGTFVSAFVPLHDAAGKVEGVLGVDYRAEDWLTSILAERASAFGVVAVLNVILIAVAGTMTQLHINAAEREKLQGQLVEASRQAGMAEIAIGVLHNVGNVLNSVNIAAEVAAEKVRQSKLPGLAKATQLIADHRTDLGDFIATDERGRQLPAYLIKLADFLAAEQQAVLTELETLNKGVEHIRQIVRTQQDYARSSHVAEPIAPVELLRDAIRVNDVSFGRHGIELTTDFADVPSVCVDKHKVVQILVNLMCNAKNAVLEHAGEQKQIRLTLSAAEQEGQVYAQIAVADTGMGIAAQNLPKLFTHGFTTRKDGHGFGLHSAANAAREIGGKLLAASDGPGRGATFTLLLPLQAQVVTR